MLGSYNIDDEDEDEDEDADDEKDEVSKREVQTVTEGTSYDVVFSD